MAARITLVSHFQIETETDNYHLGGTVQALDHSPQVAQPFCEWVVFKPAYGNPKRVFLTDIPSREHELEIGIVGSLAASVLNVESQNDEFRGCWCVI